jgi:HEAT repeat protein
MARVLVLAVLFADGGMTGAQEASAAEGDVSIARTWVGRHLQQLEGVPEDERRPPRDYRNWYRPDLSEERARQILTTAITQLESPRERTAGLRLLVGLHPTEAAEIIAGAVARETDPHLRAAELLLLGLYRDKQFLPLLRAHLKGRSPVVRAAAGDALGVLHRPAYRIPVGASNSFRGSPYLPTDPRIHVDRILWLNIYGTPSPRSLMFGDGLNRDPIELPAEVRQELAAILLQGETLPEREAAARALVGWAPEDYRLRVAEWGVWLADQTGALRLVESVLDEIPPFVHQTGNRLDEFADRVERIVIITKPILHLTADRPMAADVEVQITFGRPWLVYPRPNDFAFAAGTRYGGMRAERELPGFVLRSLQPEGFAPVGDLAEGYPWLRPSHRRYGSLSAGMGGCDNQFTSAGLRWQSLIITPKRPDWAQPPKVPPDARFQWWNRLRDVHCSWVSSRGESDRFLYYDGPTLTRSPVAVRCDGDRLRFLPQSLIARRNWDRIDMGEATMALRQPPSRQRRGLFIRVEGGRAAAWAVNVPGDYAWVELDTIQPADGEGAVEELNAMLAEAGLSAAEAGGLVDSWHQQFFQTPGQRFLLLLAREDYDAICPLRVNPEPTELARVGIVLIELPRRSAIPRPELSTAERAEAEELTARLDAVARDYKDPSMPLRRVTLLGPKAYPAAPALVRMLRRRGTYAVTQTAQALSSIGPQAVDSVPYLINDMHRGTLAPIARAIVKISPQEIAPLLDALRVEDHERIAGALLTLSLMREAGRQDLPGTAELAQAVAGDQGERWSVPTALRALGDLGADAAATLPVLEQLQHDENDHIRKAAAEAIDEIRSAPTVPE